MAKTSGSQEEIQPVNNHNDFGYWYNEMNSDEQFVRYMTEIYKKQHLNIYMNKQQNTTMTHHTRSNTQSPSNRQQITRQLPQLMDHPINIDHIQEIHHRHHHQNQTSKTSIIERVTQSSPSSTNHQVSSTPRRPLEESGSENQYQRQIKKSRPHEITPSAPSQLSTTVKPFHLPTAHLKRAVANNLPCFYIKFDNNITQRSIPPVMKVARWIRQTVQQQSSESIGDFSILIPVSTNRYKFGVTSKSDFLLLWNCKWPNEMDDIDVEIQRPRSLPDCCALKSRPHEITPSAPSQLSTTVKPFHLPTAHLKRAVANNLPCFYIKFDNNITQRSIPPVMKVARWIRQTVQQQSSESIGDFSILIPVSTNRYKFGVTSKSDFLLLWNCKWPNEMDDIDVEIQRPRSLPDCCALVVRYAPADLSNEFVYREINKSISSASSFSKINYHRPRSTNDYRFCVADANEYEEILKIGRIAIGHLLLPITAFLPGLKLTYCANCWIIGHTKPECKMNPRCRKCLDNWEFNHRCQKPILCAQCEGPHLSTSIECPVVYNYRITLKDQVKKAINDGLINQPSINQKREANRYVEDERFETKQTNGTKQA
ncbi:unnamed protein product [Rotaria magnacalcarata]|uniref:Gag-like protein n=3 Tax=Rotaria magnacalcarata TaxID=392030 RepID=A0A814ZAG4_9BILA|nr:unnamed protein product [Rotaria magnacalcarata]